jgi:hypothetical protein
MSKMGSCLLDQEEKGTMAHDEKKHYVHLSELSAIAEVELAELRGAEVFCDLFTAGPNAYFDADLFFNKCRQMRGKVA